jgi:hypothetical protein
MSPLVGSVAHIGLGEAIDRLREQGVRVYKKRYSTCSIVDYLLGIQPWELALKYQKFHEQHDFFESVCGGCRNHHTQVEGLARHTREMIGICLDLFDLYRDDLDQVTQTDIIIGCYLHDFAKIWTYQFLSPADLNSQRYSGDQFFTYRKGQFRYVTMEVRTLLELAAEGIVPTQKQAGAMLFAEGGYSTSNFGFGQCTETAKTGLLHNPLAVLVHMADIYSAGILGKGQGGDE